MNKINNTVEVACFGEPLIGFYGEEKLGPAVWPFKMVIGGDTSNVALAIAKLGHQVAYLTRLGDDFLGKYIWQAWQEAGVKTDNVIIDQAYSTGVYFALFDSNKEHQFAYKRKDSAAANYSIEDARNVSLKGIKLFYLSGISQAISQKALEASFFLLKQCQKAGIKIGYDLNYRSPLWSKDFYNSVAWQTIRKYANLVTLNIEEAKILGLAGQPEQIVEDILKCGPEIVALKLGAKGSFMGTADSITYCEPCQTEVIDTVGAGDAFTAATIVGMLEELGPKDLQRFANAVAAKVCASVGSTSGQPKREEINRLMEV